MTYSRNREAIESELATHPRAGLKFYYYHIPLAKVVTNPEGLYLQIYYYCWQVMVFRMAKRLHREIGFELAYHVTYARYWSPSLCSRLPIPFIWNVGGGESVPKPFRATLGLGGRLRERLKDCVWAVTPYDPLVKTTARRSALILTNSQYTAGKINGAGDRPMIHMESAMLDDEAVELIEHFGSRTDAAGEKKFCFASMTRLIPWKGVHLALQAFKEAGLPNSEYWIVGEGSQRKALEKLVDSLGLSSTVVFWGNPPREEWMKLLNSAGALVHTSVCDNFSPIVLEAMIAETPVISLRLGELAEHLNDDHSFFVDATNPRVAIEGLARAMRAVVGNPEEASRRAASARDVAVNGFSFQSRMKRLNKAIDDVLPNITPHG